MTAKELRNLEIKDLRAKTNELREDIFWLKFKTKTGQMEKTANIAQTRKDLARAMTVLSEKLGAQGAEKAKDKKDGK